MKPIEETVFVKGGALTEVADKLGWTVRISKVHLMLYCRLTGVSGAIDPSTLASLRCILGEEPPEHHLRELLVRASNSVSHAVNLFYDAQAATPSHTSAAASSANKKRPAAWYPTSKPKQAKPFRESTSNAPANAPDPVGAPPGAHNFRSSKPLAERMRPSVIDQLVGQGEALDQALIAATSADRIPSLILWGPPGCGKTSFASCVASSTKRIFRTLSAAKAGVSDLRGELNRAEKAQKLQRMSTILFVDEIHRWSKAQQDVLLQDVERGIVTLIGATTENPSFSLNNAILSRCRLVVFSKLESAAIKQVISRALSSDPDLQDVGVTDDAIDALVSTADGDARVALNVLELSASAISEGQRIEASTVMAAAQKRSLYDRNGDYHYDLISALHKSLRGGDPDGALYYIARMLHGGEEPRYITRRLMRFASEDIGLVEPRALEHAVAADTATHAIGMPEAGVIIAQTAIFLALAPKSTAIYKAYNSAMEAVRKQPHAPVPLHIRNAPTATMKQLGYGKGYVYNPSNGYQRGCSEGYLPKELGNLSFFDATDCEAGHCLEFCSSPPRPRSVQNPPV